ncbi:MAG TPA: hypothetical protein HPP77_03885 [Candidatus Hydrogenedentes bacterium]|nr:hypothetical protein [Candidatus Hydrogenedentota bacterium]
MTTRMKTFDCVEMKNRIQRELRKEYEDRAAELASYADFIRATAEEDEGIRAFRERIGAAKRAAGRS